MINDARVLQPEFIPSEVEHRNEEVNHLSNALRSIMDGQSGETALLWGPSGVGKTCIAQYTVERLRENVLDINSQYINCWQDYTRYRVLYRVLEGVGQALDIHRQSTRNVAALERVQNQGLTRKPGRSVEYVVVDDEKRSPDRVALAYEDSDEYDQEFYCEQLLRAAGSVLSPLGWRQDAIEAYLSEHENTVLSAYL